MGDSNTQQMGKAQASSQGIVIGRVQKLSIDGVLVVERHIQDDQVAHEIARFSLAVQLAVVSLQREYDHIRAYQDVAMILKSHLMMMTDHEFKQQVVHLIEKEHINAEWALNQHIHHLIEKFESFEDSYLRERGHDIEQVGTRILQCFQGNEDQGADLHQQRIVLTDEFFPSEVIRLWRLGVKGLISTQGGQNSHAMIVARGLGLPMLVGVSGLLEAAEDYDLLVLDAQEGAWVLRPNTASRALFERKREALAAEQIGLAEYAERPSLSRDGWPLPIMANIEFADEIDHVNEVGADGVGLFRTEFMFLQQQDKMDESKQLESYRKVIQAMQGKPVTVRLLDIGGDKFEPVPEFFSSVHSGENPAMGKRGVRLLLSYPDLLATQLRALVQASAYGPVNILVPMVTQCEEMIQVREMIQQVCKGISCEEIKLGAMIEVPASVLIADDLAQVSDFFSIGTNDLIQYTLAADRSDEEVSSTFTADHPAIQKMIELTVIAAKKANIPVSVCGELAANTLWTETFLRLGMDAISMSVSKILPIRRQLSLVSQHKLN